MRFSPDQLPVIWVGLSGKDANVLTELANDEVVPYFERQEGVASVTIEGEQTREIQLVLDEAKMIQYGILEQEVMQAIASANQSASVGTIEKGYTRLTSSDIPGNSLLWKILTKRLSNRESGASVQVEDVAEVKDTYKESTALRLVNGEPSVVLSVMKKTDANTVDVAKNIQGSFSGY